MIRRPGPCKVMTARQGRRIRNRGSSLACGDDFAAAVDEIHGARIWAGIHFRTACAIGSDMGKAVATYIAAHAMTPVNGEHEGHLNAAAMKATRPSRHPTVEAACCPEPPRRGGKDRWRQGGA